MDIIISVSEIIKSAQTVGREVVMRYTCQYHLSLELPAHAYIRKSLKKLSLDNGLRQPREMPADIEER